MGGGKAIGMARKKDLRGISKGEKKAKVWGKKKEREIVLSFPPSFPDLSSESSGMEERRKSGEERTLSECERHFSPGGE